MEQVGPSVAEKLGVPDLTPKYPLPEGFDGELPNDTTEQEGDGEAVKLGIAA